jgi:hypothetical protein
MVAAYLYGHVDVSSAKHVYTFIITDESGATEVNHHLSRQLGIKDTNIDRTGALFRALLQRMELFVVLRDTDCYYPPPIKQWWTDNLGAQRILPLNLPNLVVEVMLACVAKTTGQMDRFTQAYQSRRGETRYGAVNYETVQQSVAMVPDADQTEAPPPATSRLLVDPGE